LNKRKDSEERCRVRKKPNGEEYSFNATCNLPSLSSDISNLTASEDANTQESRDASLLTAAILTETTPLPNPPDTGEHSTTLWKTLLSQLTQHCLYP